MFVVKIPFADGSEKTRGCEKAGNAILQELKKIEINESGQEINFDALDLEEIHIDNSDAELSRKLIYENSYKTLEEKPRVVFLGGGNSINYPTAKAFFDYCRISEKNPCLIIFDAYANCKNNGGGVNSNNWLKKLVEDGFPSENILLVGARSYSREESEFLKSNRIRQIKINLILEDIDNIADTIMEFANKGEAYIFVEMSVVDPAFASAVNCLEPAGLSSREIIYLIQRLNKMKNLRAVSITGINPEKDRENLTVKLGAKILGELI